MPWQGPRARRMDKEKDPLDEAILGTDDDPVSSVFAERLGAG